MRRDSYRCRACRKRTRGQVHHVVPRRNGGTNHFSNLITLCGRCHMLVSPVPDWVMYRVWRIPVGAIAFERRRTEVRIEKSLLQHTPVSVRS
ncbi:MAG: HNH endonuclease [Pyrinomonadaceae bacterium]